MSGKSTLLRTVGHQCRARDGWRPGAGDEAENDGAGGRRDAARQRFPARRPVAILRGDLRASAASSIWRRSAGAHFSSRRALPGNQLARPQDRRRSAAQQPDQRGAIGLTTTHDLALTAIAEQSGGRIVNVHFEDQLRDGELVFDYRMKPGPVTHSNALALMRAVGLPHDV